MRNPYTKANSDYRMPVGVRVDVALTVAAFTVGAILN